MIDNPSWGYDVTGVLDDFVPVNTSYHGVKVIGKIDMLQELMDKITERFENIKINVIGIKNDFFGGGINVSGLVTGRDLINQLKGCDLGEKLLIPSVMLRREGDIFLDDVSLEEVENALNIPVVPVSNSGDMLLNEILK